MATRTPIDSDALAELLQHDPQAAFARVRDAAQAGQVDAQLLLAQMHMEGKGTAQDASAALLWYETAANNRAQALALYTRAAHLGHAKSMNLLARHLEDGLDTAPDPQAALAWYQRAAEAGDFRGQANYASILLQAGQVEQAVHWLRLALAHGIPAFMAPIVPELAASPHPQV